MQPTLRDTLELTTKKYPERNALIYPRRNQHWTYSEFNTKANQLANAFSSLGIEKGDRISTMLYNGSEIVLTVFACAKLGAVFNPLNYRLSSGEIKYILDDSESSLLLFEENTQNVVENASDNLETISEYIYVGEENPSYAYQFYDFLESGDKSTPSTTLSEDDVYGLIYTSGTTGQPKGVVHEHRDIIEHNLICAAEGKFERSDVGLSALPLYHCAELQAALFPRIQVGAATVIHHEFDPIAVLNAIEEYNVTYLFAAPTAWNSMAQAAKSINVDTSSLRLGQYGAAPMPKQVLEACRNQFCENYLQAYGMTELGPCGTFQHPDEQLTKQGSVGVPALNHDLRIVEPDADPGETVPSGEVGEILLAGPCTMREYWNRPDATDNSLREADGNEWYYTGDLGYQDEEGYLYVVDRKDDLIISGGENIYPTEVENVLFSNKDVDEAAVVGKPHDKWGEQVMAYIVGDISKKELDQYMKDNDNIANFKRPQKYHLVKNLPKTASGKIKKYELRDRLSTSKNQ